jgi:RimJ/RimL family protein N-acetyltransferase
MADELHLRPVREDDLAIIEKLTQDPELTGEFAWFGWHYPLRWRRRWAEDRLLDDASGVLMTVLGPRPLGFVSWRRHPATVAAFYWEIGIALLPEARRAGYGTQAQRLLPATCSRTPPRTASLPALR